MKNIQKEAYDRYARKYFIIDFDHLFVSTTLHDEAIIFCNKNHQLIINKTKELLKENFDIEVDENRDLNKYSGGERAIISLIFYMHIFQEKKLNAPQLLLLNVIESLSSDNCNKVRNIFKDNIKKPALLSIDCNLSLAEYPCV